MLRAGGVLRLTPGTSQEAAFAIEASLQRHGLMHDVGAGTWGAIEGKVKWRPSPYGLRLIQLLEESGAAEAQHPMDGQVISEDTTSRG